MKHILLILATILCFSFSLSAQNYKLTGKTVVQEKTVKENNDIKTDYTYKATDGKMYDIYLHLLTSGDNKGSYVAYINKVSKKTQKPYKYYLKLQKEDVDKIVKETIK